MGSGIPVREENLNVTLAQLLADQGLKALGEVTTKSKMPDILININGVRMILEGKSPGKRKQLRKQAKERLSDGLADICVMIEYQNISISTIDPTQSDIRSGLMNGKYNVSSLAFHELSGLQKFMNNPPKNATKFTENISFEELVTYLMTVYRQRVDEDTLSPVIEELKSSVEDFADNTARKGVNTERVKDVLEFQED